jgi:hypothetical protein
MDRFVIDQITLWISPFLLWYHRKFSKAVLESYQYNQQKTNNNQQNQKQNTTQPTMKLIIQG